MSLMAGFYYIYLIRIYLIGRRRKLEGCGSFIKYGQPFVNNYVYNC